MVCLDYKTDNVVTLSHTEVASINKLLFIRVCVCTAESMNLVTELFKY